MIDGGREANSEGDRSLLRHFIKPLPTKTQTDQSRVNVYISLGLLYVLKLIKTF